METLKAIVYFIVVVGAFILGMILQTKRLK